MTRGRKARCVEDRHDSRGNHRVQRWAPRSEGRSRYSSTADFTIRVFIHRLEAFPECRISIIERRSMRGEIDPKNHRVLSLSFHIPLRYSLLIPHGSLLFEKKFHSTDSRLFRRGADSKANQASSSRNSCADIFFYFYILKPFFVMIIVNSSFRIRFARAYL